MLKEFYQYHTTPCPKWAKEMGYLKEAINIRYRYARNMRAWQEHMTQTKEAILESSQKCRHYRTALILGSGMLHDIPIERLSERFNHVILADTVHFPLIYDRLKNLQNISFIHHDITETIQPILQQPFSIPHIKPQKWIDDKAIDFVVSANVLSQLAWPMAKFLNQKRHSKEDKLSAFTKHITHSHIEYLKRFDAVISLITEQKKTVWNRNHEEIEQQELLELTNEELPKPFKQWTWDIAPFGELGRSIRHEHNVVAYEIEPESKEPKAVQKKLDFAEA